MDISYNVIQILPHTLSLLNKLRNFIPPNLLRWLNSMELATKNSIYNDQQNVHNQHIQLTLKESIGRVLSTKPVIQFEEILTHLKVSNQNELIKLIEEN